MYDLCNIGKELRMTKTVLLTGATGALGREILGEMIKNDYRIICLVRSKKGQSGLDRIRTILCGSMPSNVEVLEGDIESPLCGLTDPDIQKWLGCIDTVLHQ
jgi:thioester reductase-like protein